MLNVSRPPTMMWSSTRTSMRPSACLRREVTARSAAEGSTSPDGWLWMRITSAALQKNAFHNLPGVHLCAIDGSVEKLHVLNQSVTCIEECGSEYFSFHSGDPHRPRPGVHGPGARPVGAGQRRKAGADPARQADPERLHRKFQRQVPGRVPQRELVHLARARQDGDLDLAPGLQPGPAPQRNWQSNPGSFCSHDSRSAIRKPHPER